MELARAKFLARTKIDEQSNCWIWTGALGSHKRYGSVGIAGRSLLAHRAAWILFKGSDPGSLCVCHKCDNGLCVNPEHLFLGTQKENVLDMENKQRAKHQTGEKHGRAKITAKQANEIKEKRSCGISVRLLSKEYGIAETNIYRIINGKGWITK